MAKLSKAIDGAATFAELESAVRQGLGKTS